MPSRNPMTCKWCGSVKLRIGRATAAAMCRHCDAPCGKGVRCGMCGKLEVRIDTDQF